MVRDWKEVVAAGGYRGEASGGAVFVFTAFLLSLALLIVVMFMCADGMPKDKASAHADTYGSSCAAGCGAACGA